MAMRDFCKNLDREAAERTRFLVGMILLIIAGTSLFILAAAMPAIWQLLSMYGPEWFRKMATDQSGTMGINVTWFFMGMIFLISGASGAAIGIWKLVDRYGQKIN